MIQPLGTHGFTRSDAVDLAHVLSAMSDPVRLLILDTLASAGPTSGPDLRVVTGKSQPTVSHHTRLLAAAGLVVAEKCGAVKVWRLNRPQLRDLVQALAGGTR